MRLPRSTFRGLPVLRGMAPDERERQRLAQFRGVLLGRNLLEQVDTQYGAAQQPWQSIGMTCRSEGARRSRRLLLLR